MLGIITNGLKMFLPFSSSQQLGEELVTDGNFPNGDNWTEENGWTFANGFASFLYIDVSNSKLTQDVGLTSGKTYRLTLDYTRSAGSFTVRELSGSGYVVLGTFSDVSDSIELTFNSTSNNGTLYITAVSTTFVGSISNVSVKEVGQFSLDETTNNNNAKLFTGNALDFSGNDYVDIDGFTMSGTNATFAFWANIDITTNYILDATPNRLVIGFRNNNLSLFSVDAWAEFGAISTNDYQRVVITTSGTTAKCFINGVQLGVDQTIIAIDLSSASAVKIGSSNTGSSFYYNGKLSDFQIWNVAWSATDVANDYANPNQLVSSVSVSNLKGWWAFTEGSGSFAFDNATAPGSELIVNGNFATDSNWSKGPGWSISGDVASSDGSQSGLSYLNQSGAIVSGKTYKATFELVSRSAGEVRVFVGGVENNSPKTIPAIYTEYITAGSTAFWIRASSTFVGSIRDVSVKEISAGTIAGATYEPAQSSVLQLGMINWSNGSGVFLPPSPSNATQDILGNAVRDRLNSLNLTGTGVAEVTDNNSLDFGTGDFSVETWAKWDFVNSGSSYNTIYSNGGLVTGTSNFGLVSSSTGDKIRFIVNNTNCISTSTFSNGDWVHIVGTRESGSLKLYINGNKTPEATASNSDTVTNALVKSVGKDAQTFRFYHNLIDDVRVYDRAITSTEVEQNYKAGTSAHTN